MATPHRMRHHAGGQQTTRSGASSKRTRPIHGTISWADQFLGHVLTDGTSLGRRLAKDAIAQAAHTLDEAFGAV
jgi:hypothetical protein